MHLIFKFELESEPGAKRKLKVEINTREHASFLPVRLYPFAVKSRWHNASVNISSFEPEELFGTKLRALLAAP